jgi:anti-sigma factor RsiW
MFRSIMNAFLKREDCPSSFELVAFQNGELSRGRGLEVRRHLEACDFCDAEVDFYENYSLVEPSTEEPPVIPAPLFELAEALLKGKHSDGAALNALLKEKDGLVLDAA